MPSEKKLEDRAIRIIQVLRIATRTMDKRRLLKLLINSAETPILFS